MSASQTLTQKAFQAAMNEFKMNLNNNTLYREILATKSIDEVYDLTDKLQAEQGKKGRLRHLAKIEPYLNRLREYAAVIEVFMQVQPDIIGLIWGPIKLLLQWASVLTSSFDAIVNAFADIGALLPEFQVVISMFGNNTRIYDVFVLFFRDLMDFYLVALRFFTLSRWKFLFESVWPRKQDQINVIIRNIEKHTLLLRNEVRLEHIRAEHEARLKALEHFKVTQRAHRLQQYQAIKTDVNPRMYDDKLDWYHNRVCKGTGTWLLKDAVFKKWLDATDTTSRVAWIQGIPGAGKTFLSGTAVDQARPLGRTAFVFLAHNLSSSTSALGVLHSLIFQLAAHDEDLQDVICHAPLEHIKTNIAAGAALLKSVLDCVGAVYLIVDGVDEIDVTERRILLTQLLDLGQKCPETRILFSSRNEEDIRTALGPASKLIRVDHRNTDSIQAFVNVRLAEILNMPHLPAALRDAIRKSLPGVVLKAKAMFLYAKLVLEGIELMEDVSEIAAELSVLPEDLSGVYGRVLARIEKLRPPSVRDKAKRIIGWVACSPTPLMVQEIQHALAIQPGDLKPSSTQAMAPNLDRLCGPIIEIRDGYVQFVHFTVQEYLFSPSIPGYIGLPDATLDLAVRCITLLSQTHYGPDAFNDDSAFVARMLAGQYNLHYFATNYWFSLVQNYLRLESRQPVSTQLLQSVRILMSEQRNNRFSPPKQDITQSLQFPHLKRDYPDIHNFLASVGLFDQKCAENAYHVTEGALPNQRPSPQDLTDIDKSWLSLDPLLTNRASSKLHGQLAVLMCQSKQHRPQCHCKDIYLNFGTRPLKCGFLNCSSHRDGFESTAGRKQHEASHSRLWKCDVSGCEYERTGFLSEEMKDQHLRKAHKTPAKQLPVNGMSKDEVNALIFDLAKRDEVAAIQQLLPLGSLDNQNLALDLARVLAEVQSRGMANLLAPRLKGFVGWREVFLLAGQAKRVDVLEWLITGLLERNDVVPCADAVIGCLYSDSSALHRLCDTYIKASTSMANPPYLRVFLLVDAIRATGGRPEREDFLISTWEHLLSLEDGKIFDNKFSRKTALTRSLGYVAETTCSIRLAQFLLKHGADIDGENTGPGGMTPPLHQAARTPSAQNAAFIKFLLFAGANPEKESRSRTSPKVRDNICAQELPRWLGVSWDGLVAQAAQHRKVLRARR
ncbi:hypothetical protein HK57_00235 [Aspergillus ustus]|uniref:Uncharacterized protein n=1 Tax=Aspergillus ustus TaxID=40382 RepID=A0A0C1E350_ASPUT|nr:hypothetical protein HK57_00235 [Aspergillus ustus]